ncbi:MAG: hypothetical protein ACP5MZ_02560 [Candidatus Micrarchaeia archaeon]
MAMSIDFDVSKIVDFKDVLRMAQIQKPGSSELSITVPENVLRKVLENELRNPNFHAHTIEGNVFIKYDQELPTGTMIRIFTVENKGNGSVLIKENPMSYDANLIRRMDR